MRLCICSAYRDDWCLVKNRPSLLSSCLSLTNLENGSMGGLNEIFCARYGSHCMSLVVMIFHRCTTYLSSGSQCSDGAQGEQEPWLPFLGSYRIGRTQCEMKYWGLLLKPWLRGISLVVQWLDSVLPKQGAQVQSLAGTRGSHATANK